MASIQVNLASNSLKVGQTTQATATLKDARGRAIDRAVQWSSSNTAVATVSDSGLVRGIAAGSAGIIAKHRTVSGSASLSVTASDSVTPPPPPPPPSGKLLFQENFENSSLASRGWYDGTRVQISTAEHIAGSTASAQYHFAKGGAGPTGGSTQRHKFTPSNSVYLSYYVKYSTNWVGSGQSYHPHEFYLLSTLDGDYDGLSANWMTVYVEHNYQNGGKPVISMQDNRSINSSQGALPNNLVTTTENRSTGGCNGMAESNMYSECFSSGSSWYNLK
ncbi:MAG TPA: Ig-like domain-containing protein, partial [Gemmatimonadaceae bacterium]|nr:Ig-like domain-containing protein [Gemmatimonadaceae bacterium]